jgi:DNA modification methylase
MEIGNGTFLQGDCLELMRDLPDGSVDMVMTSPPYDNLRTYNGMPPFTFDVFAPIADELARVLKPGGVIVWNVADATVNGSETGSSFRQALYFKDQCGLNLHDTMIYHKNSYIPLTHNRYEQCWEYMFVFSKGKPATFNPIKIPSMTAGTKRNRSGAKVLDTTAAERRRDEKTTVSEYKTHPNMFTYDVGKNDKTNHPAPFPLKLTCDQVESWSNPGQTILDPFAGSGTTAIAAENAGRKWICMERDPTYYESAIGRVYDHLTR